MMSLYYRLRQEPVDEEEAKEDKPEEAKEDKDSDDDDDSAGFSLTSQNSAFMTLLSFIDCGTYMKSITIS